MHEVKRIQVELLKNFIEVCEKLNLKYYLVCGSVLGAVKYQGFIPWDDDIDVALLRSDYEIFLEKAQQYLPEHVFVQTFRTDKRYAKLLCRLRNSSTTCVEQNVSRVKINHGIFIDVFPLDGYPTPKKDQDRLEKMKRFYGLLLLSAVQNSKNEYRRVRIFRSLLKLLGVHRYTHKILGRYEKMLAQYPAESSALWCNHGNWQGKLEYAPREQYGEGTWATFEGLRVRIPENYDAYLTQKYGDWRADLPEEQKYGHHFYTVYDANTPYTHYLNQ